MPVATFACSTHAEPLRKRLIENGIPAEVHDELKLEKCWFVAKPAAGVRIEVPAHVYERAYQLLFQWDTSEGALLNAIRCPECRSLRIEYPQYTRRSFIPNLVMGTLAAIARVEKEYYCEDCHFTWPKEGVRPSRLRPHMAPYYFIEGVEQTGGRQAAHPTARV
jgi:hypothetical protein